MGSSGRISLEHVLDLDYERVGDELVKYIRSRVSAAAAAGAVIGVSGGVDSALTLTLAVRALGAENVYALVMPDSRTTPREDIDDALLLIKSLGVARYSVVYIDKLVDAFSVLPWHSVAGEKVVGNLRARIRMTILYHLANTYNYLVLGTGDRSELLIGYFTKYGDGAADIYPISVLYKTQVRRLAAVLGAPERIAYKPSSPRLWPGHMAEKELGLTYEQIDLALFALFDLGLGVEEAAEVTGLEESVIARVKDMHERTMHKRECFAAPSHAETVAPYWRGLERARSSISGRGEGVSAEG